MGVIKAVVGALGGTLSDQWRDIIQPQKFDEAVAVVPGTQRSTDNGRGTNYKGSEGVITNGSKIFVPENTVAYIFSGQGIETIITEPGAYEYEEGQESVFDHDWGDVRSVGYAAQQLAEQTVDRFQFGGISSDYKKVAYVNMREIRNIKFGTRGPQVYTDVFYGVDLYVRAYGNFSVQVTDATKFIRNFVPPNVSRYSFNDPAVKTQLLSEFLQSFAVALNKLSDNYRVSKIQSHENEIQEAIASDSLNAGTWPDRFGFKLVSLGIENIEMTEESRALVHKYASKKIDVSAYEDVSKRASDIAAQQNISRGIEKHGLGEGGNMLFGMNMAQAMGTNGQLSQSQNQTQGSTMSIDEQIETLKKMKDLLDAGILTQEEFDTKKKEIMGL